MEKRQFEIDNITWNDLSLEDIFSRLNSCITSAGEDFLYYRLRHPFIADTEEFRKQKSLFSEIKNINEKDKITNCLEYLGKIKKYSYLDEIEKCNEESKESNLKHIIMGILVIVFFALIFVIPGPAIVAFFIMIGVSVSNYFKTKNVIAGKLTVFNYTIRMIKTAAKLGSAQICTSSDATLQNVCETLDKLAKEFAPFVRGTFVISEGARTTSNPFSIILDYVRMIFHIDIIKYNSMVLFLHKHIDSAKECYKIIGELDVAIVINSFCCGDDFKGLNNSNICECELYEGENELAITDGYHPMLDEPVENSVNTKKSILLTGCNASGKSTFLKMTALNAVFAQSFGFAFAKDYRAPYYRIYTSMSLNDSISNGESYYMAEIKSLKRITDAAKETSNKASVFCVVDEMLRGTNTIERIAASTEILKNFDKMGALCFAATHDIELAEMLESIYCNKHFEENIEGNDVSFSFKIIDGPAKTRNAIRLLSMLGYDDSIIENATHRADVFVSEGKWIL